MSVISLEEKRREREPHSHGTAKCMNCKHEWEAVVPTGTHVLDCPQCESHRGMWKYPFAAPVGSAYLSCANCDSEHLYTYIMQGARYVRCASCGSDMTSSFFT